MASPLATRIWAINKEAGRPFPRVSSDDVIDYMVIEALALSAMQDRKKGEDDRVKREWQAKTDELRKRVGA